jgi:hypothetical protein
MTQEQKLGCKYTPHLDRKFKPVYFIKRIQNEIYHLHSIYRTSTCFFIVFLKMFSHLQRVATQSWMWEVRLILDRETSEMKQQ